MDYEVEIETKENGISPDRRYLYVCEGVTDEDKLKKLGCFFVVKTGGKFIRKEILDFIEKVSKVREIVLVLDPDGPGKYIGKKIRSRVGNCFTAHIDKEKAIKNNKVGVAQMEMNDLKEALRPFIKHDLFVDENISIDEDDFLELGLTGPNSSKRRELLIKKYSLPYTSSKNVFECILMLGLTKKEIIKDLENE